MAVIRHLKNAPITEAVLDFRVRPGEVLDSDVADTIANELSERYPQRAMLEEEMVVEANQDTPRRLARTRHRLDSSDGHWVVQFRTEGISVSMLQPYTRWENLQNEATTLWRLYEKAAKPVHLVRVSTRFINHLQVQRPDDDFVFRDYLTAPLEVPEGLPKQTSSYWINFVVHEGNDLSTSITQALLGFSSEHVAVLIDTDTHKIIENIEIPVPGPVLEAAYRDLRSLKNKAFFSSITEETANIYA